MASAAPTLTLQDIADLAQVRRPVVSMWRRRPMARGRFLPFPEPVGSTDGVERFSRDDIVDWLEQTGRGNNGEARLDAPALSVPAGTSLEDLVTLLCLRAVTTEELADTGAREREALACSADPLDEFLLSEVRSIEPTKDALRFIDDLVEVSYGTGEALDRLERGPIGRATGARELTKDAISLVRIITKACGLHIDPEDVPIVHHGTSTTLTLAVATEFTHLVVPGDGAPQRALRRRAAIRGIEVSAAATGPSVRVVPVVGCEFDAALDVLDEVVVELGEGDVAVILGAAAILCDELRGEHERKRAETLRAGNLALALRLPRGLWREAHRQALGIWVCAGGPRNPRPLVADLAAFAGPELVPCDLAADVAGALAGGGARAFRYARPDKLQRILSAHTVVPRGVRALRFGSTDTAPHLDRIHAATLVTTEPVESFDVLVAAAPGSVVLRKRSLGELKDQRHVHVRRGSRIAAEHTDPAGSVAVLSAAGDAQDLRLDPFDADALYPRAARTEPGDVVFVERPRPMALVDHHGGSLVASPSKILRLTPAAGIGPNAVAAIIKGLPADAGEWQSWSVPVLDPAEAELLEETLAAAAGYETSVRQRLDAVHELVASLINGIAVGAVTLKTNTTKQEGQ